MVKNPHRDFNNIFWESLVLYQFFLLLALLMSTNVLAFEITYQGRLIDDRNLPVEGPLDLAVSFFHGEDDPEPLPVPPLEFMGVATVAGKFAITIPLSGVDLNVLLPNSDPTLYLQIFDITHQKIYPRQKINALPYALRIPVGDNLQFGEDGKLTTTATLKLGAEATGEKVELKAHPDSPEGTTYRLPRTPEANKFLTVDSAGNLSWDAASFQGMDASVYDANSNLKVDGAENSDKLNGQSAAFYLNLDNASEGNSVKHFTAASKIKLAGIQAGADQTNAQTVAAAGAVMKADFVGSGIMEKSGAEQYNILAYSATNQNNTMVLRDGSGGFAAGVINGTFQGPLTGDVMANAITLADGNEGPDKVLISDSDGAGRWQTPKYFGQSCSVQEHLIGFTADGNIICQGTSHGFSKVAAGNLFVCGLLTNGNVSCFGRNQDGAIGDNSTIDRWLPTLSYRSDGSPHAGVTAIAAGAYHFCSIQSGKVYCQGWNQEGQLGDGTNITRKRGVLVSGISDAVKIAAGGYHTCAIHSQGTVSCWGYNLQGQLGNGTQTASNTPVVASGISNATHIAAGHRYTCAILSDGTAKCFGHNYHGELGDGSNTNRLTPVTVAGLSNLKNLDAGSGLWNWHDSYTHTCAAKNSGEVWCWGNGSYGQLGNGGNTVSNTPVQVFQDDNRDGACTEGVLTNIIKVKTGARASCGLKTDGSLWCWGKNYGSQNSCAQPAYGLGGTGSLSGVLDFDISADYNESIYAVFTDSKMVSWGHNWHGMLGINSTEHIFEAGYVQQ
jgi:alpha-tubulin suppressor-like RCC1 family protein